MRVGNACPCVRAYVYVVYCVRKKACTLLLNGSLCFIRLSGIMCWMGTTKKNMTHKIIIKCETKMTFLRLFV